MGEPTPSREELRARLRAKTRRGKSSATTTPPAPQAAAEAAVMRAVGDDPQMLRMAHAVLRNPGALRGLVAPSPTPRADVPPIATEEDEEEGLPPEA
jgi:hypothetical protein